MRRRTLPLMAFVFALNASSVLAQAPGPFRGHLPDHQNAEDSNPLQCGVWDVREATFTIHDPSVPPPARAFDVFIRASCGDLAFYLSIGSDFDPSGYRFFHNDLTTNSNYVIFFEDPDHQWLFTAGVYSLALSGRDNLTLDGEMWRRSRHTPDLEKVAIPAPVVMTIPLSIVCRVWDPSSRGGSRIVSRTDDDYPRACARITNL